MAKYSQYIEISPDYESVVDLDAEERHPNLWQEYIVHDDMATAVDKICQSLKYENKDARRSFWIHGTYGTGKSYAAIVLKHLFEDSEENIRGFMSNAKLLPYRDKFLALRKKGPYLVVWKSGCAEVRTGVQLIMEMEVAIRQALTAKYGANAYLGSASTLDAVQERLEDNTINWEHVFKDPAYALYEDYTSFSELKTAIDQGDLKAANRIARVIYEKGWGLFSTTEPFKAWLKDIIAGNHLEGTGIVFLWDEFTDYLRNCNDSTVLQELSEYCKVAPFFLCLIVHKDSSWVDALGEDTYNRIVHRYHDLYFRITESATYDLIGNSILPRPGMDAYWDQICDDLMQSISSKRGAFQDADLGSGKDRNRDLCPIHPMTVSLLAKVAENFGASQRTLFRFMKDPEGKDKKVGFLYYIDQYGPDEWKWLTPEFLWDYFFLIPSDIKEFSPEAQRCYRHYLEKQSFVSNNDVYFRVFKVCLLLIAMMSNRATMSSMVSRATNGKLNASRNTVVNCFAGVLDAKEVDGALDAIEQDKLLRFDRQPNGDARMELPFTGESDAFEKRLADIKKKYSRNIMFGKDGFCAKALEDKMWDGNDVLSRRILIKVSSAEKHALLTRQGELLAELEKKPYAMGLLVVAPAETAQYVSVQAQLQEMAAQDTTQRLMVCAVSEPFTEEKLNRWQECTVKSEMAGDEGQRANANTYALEAQQEIAKWAGPAAANTMAVFCASQKFPNIFGVGDLMQKMKKNVIYPLFTYAPERFIILGTAYRASQTSSALAGIQRVASNTQMANLLQNVGKEDAVWKATSIEALAQCSGTVESDAVGALAAFVNKYLTEGAKVKLDALWQELQRPPFGYYDTIACAFLLGYVLHFYVNQGFTWIDNAGNPHILSDQTMATMIVALCKGKTVNDTLSSGTVTWRKFQPYAQKIFSLKAEECTDEQQTRKMIKATISDSGVPFWSLKYLAEENFGGMAAKDTATKVIDQMQRFLNAPDEAEDAMANVVNAFSGNGQIRQKLQGLYAAPPSRYLAFREFLFQNNGNLQQQVQELALSDSDLFMEVRKTMMGDTASWLEEDVRAQLASVSNVYALLLVLDKAMGTKHKMLAAVQSDLKNCFQNMKVPGSVIETLGFDWIDALKILHTISTETGFSSGNLPQEKLDILTEKANTAWQFINAPKLLLAAYLKAKDIVCTEEELNSIFAGLRPYPYEVVPATFVESVESQMSKIKYSRTKQELQALWTEKTSTDSISSWCKTNEMPIGWMFDDAAHSNVVVVHDVQQGHTVTLGQLCDAYAFLQGTDLTILNQQDKIQDAFFSQVGEKYRNLMNTSHDVIFAKIRGYLGADIYSWETKAGVIIRVMQEQLVENAKQKDWANAKTKAKEMPESDLRTCVEKMLQDKPELSTYFI